MKKSSSLLREPMFRKRLRLPSLTMHCSSRSTAERSLTMEYS